MTADVIIREASVDDARRIAEIHIDAWLEAYRGLMPGDFLDSITLERRQSRWTTQLETGSWNVLVGVIDHDVAGWITHGASRDEDANTNIGEVYALNVDPKYWGRGAGQALCRESCRRLFDEGFEVVTLWVLEANPRARRFYEAFGFRLESGAHQDFKGPDFTVPEVRYRLAPEDFEAE